MSSQSFREGVQEREYSSIKEYPVRLDFQKKSYDGFFGTPGKISEDEAGAYAARVISAVKCWSDECEYELGTNLDWMDPDPQPRFWVEDGSKIILEGKVDYDRKGEATRAGRSDPESVITVKIGCNNLDRRDIETLEDWIESMEIDETI